MMKRRLETEEEARSIRVDQKEEECDQVEEKQEQQQEQEKQQQQLDFESQGLEVIPFERITQHTLENELVSISLKRNRLSVIGTELYSFTTLHTLDLSRNKIHTIAAGISNLVHLERLILLSNKLKLSTIPLEELAAMPSLAFIDLRYNEKIEKVEASKTIRALFGSRALLSDKGGDKGAAEKVDSACDRDGDVLRDQLAPWSTPQLRQRLRDVFKVTTDPETVGRDGVMELLLQAYARAGPRAIVLARGVPVAPALVDELTACLRGLSWPTTTRERPKVQAYKYFTLQRPDTKFTVETGAKAKLNAAKLEKYADIWELLNRAIASVDAEFAVAYTGVAITQGFKDSPHIDTENIGPFYAISLGDFSGGGCIAVESAPCEVTHLTTFQTFAKVDGRFPHWVTKYSGERYSLIYYRTVGEVTPITKAAVNAIYD